MTLKEKIARIANHPYASPLMDIVRIYGRQKADLQRFLHFTPKFYRAVWQRAVNPNNTRKTWLKKMPPGIRFVADLYKSPFKKTEKEALPQVIGGILTTMAAFLILAQFSLPAAVVLAGAVAAGGAGYGLAPPLISGGMVGIHVFGYGAIGFAYGCVQAVRHAIGKPPLKPIFSKTPTVPPVTPAPPPDANHICKKIVDNLYSLDADERQKIFKALRQEFRGDYSDMARETAKNINVGEDVKPLPRLKVLKRQR